MGVNVGEGAYKCDPGIPNKPPLGLKPKYIHEAQRLSEISAAINRYMLFSKEIPIEWVEEYNELARNRYNIND